LATASPSPYTFINLARLLALPGPEVDEMFWQRACELRVCVPAVVVSFDSAQQTVTVQPAIQEKLLQNGVPVPTNLPQLPNVVLGVYRIGGFNIAVQPAAGDEGLVMFCDMCIDDWWQRGAPAISGNPSPPMPGQLERRRHDLSDGWFLPMGYSQARLLGSFPAAGTLQIRTDNNAVAIDLTSDSVTITPDGGTTKVVATSGSLELTATTVTVNGELLVNGELVVEGNISQPSGYTAMFDGTANFSGTTTFTGSTTIQGYAFLTHMHSGVATGASNTGGVD
jgi:hypothetical protein